MRLLSRRQAFGVAAVIAMIVAGLVYLVLNTQTRPPEEKPATVSVLVATQDIEAYTPVTTEMVTTQEMAANEVPAGYLSRPDEALGQVTRRTVLKGDVFTRQMVGPRTAEGGLTFVIPEGMRAVTVALDPVSGVGGFVLPGDRVDVLATFKQDDVAITKTILQNVEVLAMGETTTRPRPGGAGGAQVADQADAGAKEGDQSGAPRAGETIQNATLAVTPDQAQALILTAFTGSVHMVLRPREDQSVVSLPAQANWELMGLEGPPGKKEASEAEREEVTPEERMAAMGYPPAMWQQQPPAQPQAAPAVEAPEPEPEVEVIRVNERDETADQ